MGCVIQPIAVALNDELEPIGVSVLPLLSSQKQAKFSYSEMIRSFMDATNAEWFRVFIKHNRDQSLFPMISEFRLGLELEDTFVNRFIDLAIFDECSRQFRALKADRWLPDLSLSCYQDADLLYSQCIAQKFECLEEEIKDRDATALASKLNIRKSLTQKLQNCSIKKESDVRRIGSTDAWMRMKLSGEHVTSRDLFALEAAIRGIPITELTDAEKRTLKSKIC